MAFTSVEGVGHLGKAHLGVAEVSGSSPSAVPQNPSPSVVVGCSAPLDSAPVARAEVQRLASKGPQGLGVPRGRSRGRSSSKRTQPRDNKAVVNLPEKVLEAADPKWSQCLVGYFVGKKLPFKLTEAALTQAWGPKLAGVMANGQGFYFLHIPDADFRRKILEGGLITVARVPLVLQQWKPLMDLKKDNHSTVPVWIRLKNLPCELWSPQQLAQLLARWGNLSM
ncbi:uncharacterized protein LOC120288931 [Eucalyptus grandis]|uniref:uncharacterized protein LOC120288931 n=1 Tax=Eucalyptus grandis TaxID=71139 RepID=UPI00192EF0BC|nr:uncharacterized protein LOC120288931 [Eucalyptus grandis]